MYSSVKFLSPRVIGGLPLPGLAALPDELELLDDDEELPPELEDDEELPQAANTTTATRTPTIPSAPL
jgi:hypothetical protein